MCELIDREARRKFSREKLTLSIIHCNYCDDIIWQLVNSIITLIDIYLNELHDDEWLKMNIVSGITCEDAKTIALYSNDHLIVEEI